MPKIQRANLPPALLAHLLDRVQQRGITVAELMQILRWIDTNPTVPEEEWFKRFGKVTVCGEGALIKTFLTAAQTAIGFEVD